MSIKRNSVLFLALLSFGLFRVEAQAINAASCNASDVQTAFNAVTGSTTTVNIPSGTCTWTTGVSLTIPSGNTKLAVLGAGNQSTVGGGDQTVIVDNVSHSPNDNPALQVNTGATTTVFRLSGVTFESNGSSSASYSGSIRFSGNSNSVRVDHSHLAMTVDGKQMTVGGCVYGVMDHSIVDLTPGSTNNGIFLDQGSCGGDSLGVGDGQWNMATTLGSANFFYFENDTFNGGVGGSSNVVPFANDCSGGGRFVFRYNTMNAVEMQGHGTGHSDNPPDRGCRAYEIYNNTLALGNASQTWPVSAGFYDASGTGVIWGNNVTGYYLNLISGHVNLASDSTYAQSAPPNGWGYCGTAQTGTSSNWDGDTNSTGYPCLDQIGRGKGDLLQGSFPDVFDATLSSQATTYTGTWPHQAQEPVYEWLDNWTAVPEWPGSLFSETDTQAQPNRDFYTYTTSFTGASGTGSGTLSARPATCTTGVVYWATDQGNWNQSGVGGQGELFQCSASNTWTLYYTPYTYPHPLTATGAAPTAPTALQGGVVVN